MPTIRFAPLARADLREIRDYIGQDDPMAARGVVARIRQACLVLAENPLAGRRRAELAPELRSFSAGNYVILYVPSRDGIDIARVLHGSRDASAIFKV